MTLFQNLYVYLYNFFQYLSCKTGPNYDKLSDVENQSDVEHINFI